MMIVIHAATLMVSRILTLALDSKDDITIAPLLTIPELDDNRRRADLSAQSKRVRVPIIPSRRETHGSINVARAVLWNSTWEGEPGSHLAETSHHGEDGDTCNCVAQQDRDWTAENER